SNPAFPEIARDFSPASIGTSQFQLLLEAKCYPRSLPDLRSELDPRGQPPGEIVKSDLVAAICEKRLIEFGYKGARARVVEPHDYGIRGGSERLLAFQISGQSKSGA